jgi:hypothetical protein
MCGVCAADCLPPLCVHHVQELADTSLEHVLRIPLLHDPESGSPLLVSLLLCVVTMCSSPWDITYVAYIHESSHVTDQTAAHTVACSRAQQVRPMHLPSVGSHIDVVGGASCLPDACAQNLVVPVLLDVAQGMAYIHAKGIIHGNNGIEQHGLGKNVRQPATDILNPRSANRPRMLPYSPLHPYAPSLVVPSIVA